MIKAMLIGVTAVVAVIAGEMGTDKVLVMRQARSGAAIARTTEARKTHEIRSLASRTARSRATP